MSYDILGLGCVAVDDVLYVDAYPAADKKVQVQKRVRRCGGQTGNALIAAARLGAKCAYAGTLGDDPLSTLVRSTLEREGIDISAVRTDPSARPIHSTVIVDRLSGTRTIFYDLTGACPAQPGWPYEDLLRRAGCLLIDQFGIEGILEAAQIAGLQHMPIVGGFETANQPGFDRLLFWTDHLILGCDFALSLTGASDVPIAVCRLWPIESKFRTRKAVVVTCGSRGCWFLGRGGNDDPVYMPAFPIEVCDSTGCGDVFRGAYAAAGEVELEEKIRFASAAAALKAQNDDFPCRVDVEAFLARQPSIH